MIEDNEEIERAHNIDGIIISEYQLGKIYKIYSPQTEMIYIGSTIYDLSHRFKGHVRNAKDFKEGRGDATTSYKLLGKYNDCQIMLIENYPCNRKRELLKREGYYIQKYKNICVNKYIPGKTNRNYSKKYKEKLKQNKEKIICICGKKIAKYCIKKHEKSMKHKESMKYNMGEELIPVNNEIEDLIERLDEDLFKKPLINNEKEIQKEKIDNDNIESSDTEESETEESNTEYSDTEYLDTEESNTEDSDTEYSETEDSETEDSNTEEKTDYLDNTEILSIDEDNDDLVTKNR